MLYWDRLYSIKEIFLDYEIDSTNAEALRRIRCKNARHGDLILALSQSEGRGQRGNYWNSREGNIFASLIIKHKLSEPESLPVLNMAIACTLREAISSEDSGEIYTLKWPNDLMKNEKKIGGILIENIWQGTVWQWSVVGFGINLITPDASLIHADAISSSYHEVMHKIKSSLIKNIFSDDLNPATILSHYNDHLYKKDKMSQLQNGSETFEGIIRFVDIHGDLNMEIGGILKTFKHGEARLVYGQ